MFAIKRSDELNVTTTSCDRATPQGLKSRPTRSLFARTLTTGCSKGTCLSQYRLDFSCSSLHVANVGAEVCAGMHFISGLPRSGSTLLAALLRQSPSLHASITSPVGSMMTPLLARDFDDVRLDAAEFDVRLGTPGLHHIGSRVKGIGRRSILPPDLWARYEGYSLWRAADFNVRKVTIACEGNFATASITEGASLTDGDLKLH